MTKYDATHKYTQKVDKHKVVGKKQANTRPTKVAEQPPIGWCQPMHLGFLSISSIKINMENILNKQGVIIKSIFQITRTTQNQIEMFIECIAYI